MTPTPSDSHAPSSTAHRAKSAVRAGLDWYLRWALPGLGMFCEAYIIFSIGLIKPFQEVCKSLIT